MLGEELIAESSKVGSRAGEAPDRNDRALAGLRIAVGILFLVFGEYKVFGREFVFGGGFDIVKSGTAYTGPGESLSPSPPSLWRD